VTTTSFGTNYQTYSFKNKTPNNQYCGLEVNIKTNEWKRGGDELNPRGKGGESLPSSGGR
jgi:hypothetical protein